eukprot:COSAG06_NODE_66404_length_254_cov_0.980645_1_plen_59_part_01
MSRLHYRACIFTLRTVAHGSFTQLRPAGALATPAATCRPQARDQVTPAWTRLQEAALRL